MSIPPSNTGISVQARDQAHVQAPGFSCSDFTPRRHVEDEPVPYGVHSSAWPIPYRLTETAPHYEDMDQRAREAGL